MSTAPTGRLAAALHGLGATGDVTALGKALAAAWAEPHRVYHGTGHLLDCLRELDEAPPEGADPALVEVALWFHDAVYDPRAGDNERRSAAWAERALPETGVAVPQAREVARIVLLTSHLEPASDPAGALACDVDLAILGRPPGEYDEFERRIRAEYAWVPDPVFRAERRRVLARFLAREPLYSTSYFRERYEVAAHRNLERAVSRLAEG